MFTGLVEEVGRVVDARPLENGRVFRIGAAAVMERLAEGDSIAVDGACQTVTAVLDGAFEVQSIATTLERTTFGSLEPGRRVHLERALTLGARLGGHLVQGHVDGVGEVVSLERRGELVLIDFRMPPEVAGVTILHGSITLNGISLTVNALPAADVAQVSIIPYTWDHTALRDLEVGSRVNLEGDMIGKFVRRLLGSPMNGGGADLLRAWGYQ